MPRFVDDPRKPSLGHPYRDPETGKDFPSEMSWPTTWAFHEAIQIWGIDRVHEMAIVCANLVKHELTEADKQRLRWLLQNMQHLNILWGNQMEMALERTYHYLRNGEINYEQAAHIASSILGKPIKADTWRRRITRWADKQGRPKIERRQFHGRRPPEVDNNTGQL